MDDALQKELIHHVSRFYQRNKLRRKLTWLNEDLKQKQKLIDELTQDAQTELEDVEILKQRGLPYFYHKLRGSLDDKISAEEREMLDAFSKLEKVHESLLMLQNEIDLNEKSLKNFSDVDSVLEILAFRIDQPETSGLLGTAFSTMKCQSLISDIDGKLEFGEQSEEELKAAQTELQLAQVPGPLAGANTRLRIRTALHLTSAAVDHLNFFDSDLKKDTELMREKLSQIQTEGGNPNSIVLLGLIGVVTGNPLVLTTAAIGSVTGNPNRHNIENIRRRILKNIKALKRQRSRAIQELFRLEKHWDTLYK
ncbi:MAG: hypothetical protein AAF902_15300 [Chloroflexota bacterium]